MAIDITARDAAVGRTCSVQIFGHQQMIAPPSLAHLTHARCVFAFRDFFKGEHLQPEESSFQQLDLFARERNPIFLAESYFRPDCPSPLNGQKVEDEEARERAATRGRLSSLEGGSATL